jgi:membrane fusion protein, multidrug efflux system
MRVKWISAVSLLALLVAGCSRTPAAQQKGGKGGQDPSQRAIPVAAAPVTPKDVPVYLSGLGNVAGSNTVTVKSRVDGQLVEVNFKEGQQVKKGDLLAVIDFRPYQATLDQTKATLAKDEAALADAKTNLERYAALVREQVIAQQQYDTQKSQVGQIEGQIGADKAQIENAQLQLNYTHITAPIPGVVGLRLVDVGNTIHASDPNGLVVITQIEPIAVIFTLPEDALEVVMQRMKSGELDADAYTRDDQTKIATGKLVTVNNQIDPTTGTDKFKAIFDNKGHTLWPNQFVNVRLLLQTKKNALTIPVAAIQRGAQGNFVYVVKPDSTVESRDVQTSTTEGGIATVDKGLSAGEMVVTDGQDKLQPGSKVAVQGGLGGSRRQAAAKGQGSSGGDQE